MQFFQWSQIHSIRIQSVTLHHVLWLRTQYWAEKESMKFEQISLHQPMKYLCKNSLAGNAHSFIKVRGSITVPSTSWTTSLDMAVVDINKNFLYNSVRPAFWEVDSSLSLAIFLPFLLHFEILSFLICLSLSMKF